MADSANKNKIIAAAQKFVQKGQFDKAIKEYLKIVEEDPRDVRIWLKIGDLYSKKNATKDAIATYAKVAEFYSEQGFYLKAVAVYKQILKIDPGQVEFSLRLAELNKQLGLLSEAMRQYEEVASFFNQQGRPKEALAALRQVVELDPQNVASRIKLAELYSKESMRDEAVEEFTKAADFLRADGRLDDFIKVAERLVFHQPENMALTKELAQVYLQRKDPRRALQKLQIAFKADPRNEETLNMLAQAFQDLGQTPKAVAVLKELANIYADVGQENKKREIMQRVLAITPNDPEALQFMGQTSAPAPVAEQPRAAGSSKIRKFAPASPPVAKGPVSEPMEMVRSAEYSDYGIEEEPPLEGDPQAEVIKIITESEVYIKYGLQDKAVEHLRTVFNYDPQNIEVRLKLKDLFSHMGKYAAAAVELTEIGKQLEVDDPRQAAAYINEALELDPANIEARQLISRLENEAEPMSADGFVEEGGESLDLDASDIVEEIPIEVSAATVEAETEAAAEAEAEAENRLLVPHYIQRGGGNGAARASAAAKAAARKIPEDENEEEEIPLVAIDSDENFIATSTDGVAPQLDDEFQSTYHPPPSGVLELRGEITDTIGTGTPSSEIIPLGVEPEPNAARMRAKREEESSGIEDDLEEADFFLQQNLFQEARGILSELVKRYPNNALVAAKMADLDQAEQQFRDGDSGLYPRETGTDLASELAAELDNGDGSEPSTALDEQPSAGDYSVQDVFDEFKKSKSEQISDKDTDTHYDLGIAYREMGLLDDAISEFQVAMQAREREVLCHMMIGLCFSEKDQLSEAISQFKTGLYVEGITDRETIALYFELGQTYEKLGDQREALYYYEKVGKKDLRFRDTQKRIDRLRASGVEPEASDLRPLPPH